MMQFLLLRFPYLNEIGGVVAQSELQQGWHFRNQSCEPMYDCPYSSRHDGGGVATTFSAVATRNPVEHSLPSGPCRTPWQVIGNEIALHIRGTPLVLQFPGTRLMRSSNTSNCCWERPITPRQNLNEIIRLRRSSR